MISHKQRFHNTELENLISNLRGEVGDILLTWLLSTRPGKMPGIFILHVEKDLSMDLALY